MEFFHALILGILEGLTEFIPVSSTGHLILAGELLGFQSKGKVFEIAIQLGAILAVCWVYAERLFEVGTTLHNNKNSQRFVLNIALGFLPAAVLGVMFHGFIKEVLFSPVVVSISLIVGGVIILIVERLHITPTIHSTYSITPLKALIIGLFQALAMIPGTSRSGATIIGALLLKLDRKTATEFSFFLAIPTMLGAVVYDMGKNFHHLTMDDFTLIAIGFVSAFIAALLVVRSVIAFITRHGFAPFGWYRIALGSVMLAWFVG